MFGMANVDAGLFFLSSFCILVNSSQALSRLLLLRRQVLTHPTPFLPSVLALLIGGGHDNLFRCRDEPVLSSQADAVDAAGFHEWEQTSYSTQSRSTPASQPLNYSTPNLYLPIEVRGTPQGVVASTTCGLLQNVRIELNIAANANQHTT